MECFFTNAWLQSEVHHPEALSCEEAIAQLLSYCDSFGIEVKDMQLARMVRHLQLMLEKNDLVNLTAIRDAEKAVVLHTFDSLLFSSVLKKQISGSFGVDAGKDQQTALLDMGTGGGFPGIPLACLYENDVVVSLLDSVGKKVAACREFVEDLQLVASVECIHSRIEDLGKERREGYDIVVARALASLDVLVEYAAPLLKMGGFLVCGKGSPTTEELKNADKTAYICGFKNVSRETFELPDGFGHREFHVYQKISRSKVRLPRKNGEARRNPLAKM